MNGWMEAFILFVVTIRSAVDEESKSLHRALDWMEAESVGWGQNTLR